MNERVRVRFGEQVSVEEATKFVSDDSCGAISVFVGVTRKDTLEDGVVKGLEFEAHVPLGTAVMTEIISDYLEEEPGVKKVYMCHRLGYVGVGDTNVVLAVSSAHRQVSMRAVEAIMHALKAKLPVWKKEVFENGQYVWKANQECTLASN